MSYADRCSLGSTKISYLYALRYPPPIFPPHGRVPTRNSMAFTLRHASVANLVFRTLAAPARATNDGLCVVKEWLQEGVE